MNFLWQKSVVKTDFDPVGIISIDQHISNSGTRLIDTANVYRATESFNNGTLKVEKEIVPVEQAKRLIEEESFLDITAKGWGIDVINTDHFSFAALGYLTDEWDDQVLLVPVFDHGEAFGEAGVPYSRTDEDLTQRLPNWINITIDSGRVLRVNPKYLPEDLQAGQNLQLPESGRMQSFRFSSFALPSIPAFG